MKGTNSISVMIGNREMVIESGVLAKQAAGAVTVKFGDTMVFTAVTCSKEVDTEKDYFPLHVEYREKFYAAGKFPGGFFKRESRPTEKEILTARMTDRPIRPLFPSSYRNEVQVNTMVLSADGENDSDILCIVGASAALMLSEIPFLGPIGGVRVGRVDGQFVINPTFTQRAVSDIDLVYACTSEMPIMIEGCAKEVDESAIIEAMRFAHSECIKLIEAQIELRRRMGLPAKVAQVVDTDDHILVGMLRETAEPLLRDALRIQDMRIRENKIAEIKKSTFAKIVERYPVATEIAFNLAFDNLLIELVRSMVVLESKRLDGRGHDDIRPIQAEVSILPRAHGSALFTRGETQAIGTVTLGTKSDIQELDAVTGGVDEKRFMVHYNFPPYCTGEIGKIAGPGRREIGHGALAERSLAMVVPSDFPYTIRLVSDIMSSNGSSSMASVCVGSLALMDAGVPMPYHVAGVSIGLMSWEDKTRLLVDIIGAEDHCGDMDFKVAGTVKGITGFQVDVKIRGLPWHIVEEAFKKARIARLKILEIMDSVIKSPRPELSPYAPRIHRMQIDTEKIGELIGPSGKNIRRITELTGTQIDIEDDGTVWIFSKDHDAMMMAIAEIQKVSGEVEEGMIYNGVVTGIKEYGAFVEVLPGKDGLVHISEMADVPIKNVSDVCKVGDRMWVKCIGFDSKGRIKLSRKAAMKERQSPAV